VKWKDKQGFRTLRAITRFEIDGTVATHILDQQLEREGLEIDEMSPVVTPSRKISDEITLNCHPKAESKRRDCESGDEDGDDGCDQKSLEFRCCDP